MKKKFFAILVAGAVFFSMLPMVAFGDTGNGSEPPNGKVITCKVTVVPHLKYTKVTLWKQSSQTNKLLGATSKVKWKTSSKKIATVSSKGKIKEKKAGKCKVTAVHKGKKYVCTVYVRNPKLRSKKATIHNTAYYQQRVTGGSGKIKWTTSNKKVATVNSKGKITARKAGKCTITAVRNGVKMRCKVTVPSKYQGTKVPDFGAKFGKLRYDTEHWGEDPDVHIYYKKVSKDQEKKYLAAVKKAGLKKQKMSDGRTCYQHANGDGITYSLKKGKLHINLYNIHDFENSGDDEE